MPINVPANKIVEFKRQLSTWNDERKIKTTSAVTDIQVSHRN